MATESEILRVLEGLGAEGLASPLTVQDGVVTFAMTVPRGMPLEKAEALRAECVSSIQALPGIREVRLVLTQEKPAEPSPKRSPEALPGIQRVIAVASGKGGVGKSTIAVNLAASWAQQGLRVGILDCDIYGPSLPLMLGLLEKPAVAPDKKIIPFERHGMRTMSIGCLIPLQQPTVWRGPMVHHALMQLLTDVAWGELDVLVLDMPPGTGDAHLSLAQKVQMDGVVMVSTPQDLALLDALKGWRMFEGVGVPLLGLIENMSVFTCPACGHESPIFGHGGAAHAAQLEGLPFLGAIPLTLELRTAGDSGTPFVMAHPDAPETAIFKAIAGDVWRQY